MADPVLDSSKEDVLARMRELTGGSGADVAPQCTGGVNAALDTMLEAVSPGAVVVNVSGWGAPATVTNRSAPVP